MGSTIFREHIALIETRMEINTLLERFGGFDSCVNRLKLSDDC